MTPTLRSSELENARVGLYARLRPKKLRNGDSFAREVARRGESCAVISGLEGEQMDRRTSFPQVWSAASCRSSRDVLQSPYSGGEAIPRLIPGEALALVVLFSLALWALIWGAVSLLR
jgi:hypothetical protein